MLTAREIVQQQPPASLSVLALKVFFNIAQEWQLTPLQQRILLGCPNQQTFQRWCRNDASSTNNTPELPKDTLERIGCIMIIYRTLRLQLPDAQCTRTWLYCANTSFQGKSALNVMLQGNMSDLIQVEQHLG
ncbi:MAG: DUF2384 domain-containing protein [Marinobacterium sp.]|nr:DUF2384 domain-containing protein [Marinobacterium sp.]